MRLSRVEVVDLGAHGDGPAIDHRGRKRSAQVDGPQFSQHGFAVRSGEQVGIDGFVWDVTVGEHLLDYLAVCAGGEAIESD